MELVDICNQENWCTSFQVANGELTTALYCNEKTLIGWRQSLVNAGLLIYTSGKSKRAFGIYELVVETAVKITANVTTDQGTNLTANPGTNPSDYNKLNKRKTKQNTGAGGKPPRSKNKGRDFWEPFVATWDEFYASKNNGSTYAYQAKDMGCLAKIYDFLKARAAAKKFEWNEDNLKGAFSFFLRKAYDKDQWMRDNFSIPNLLSQFNQIANESARKKEQPATGADVNTSSIFSKINAMPG
ncbi:MAG: hypothetical protein KGO82_16565 [Bacteroidota bacterium]|nr:hypothetical protein [Bacteroidota bacterium]